MIGLSTVTPAFSLPGTLRALGLVLLLEAAALFFGQRRLFWLAVDATGSRLLGYLLAMPGTVLHEGAHSLTRRALRARHQSAGPR